MTDSTSGPGTGPSSAKLAALSIQSYHLDSPPFTGAAVGAGLGSAAQTPQQQPHAHDGPLSPSQQQTPGASGSGAAGSSAHSRSPLSREASRRRASPDGAAPAHGGDGNGDVPRWRLDARRTSNGYRTERSPSRTPQRGSASSPSGSGSASAAATTGSAEALAAAAAASALVSGDPEAVRPAYTRTYDVDGFGEERSEAPADDAYDELLDEERGEALAAVPVQGQRRVRRAVHVHTGAADLLCRRTTCSRGIACRRACAMRARCRS
jgi:hypothetical protein